MKCIRVCVYLLISVCLASHAAFAARPPANATYYVVAIGIDEAYGTRAECFTFTSDGLCSLDGEICGSWQPLDTSGNETSFAFDLVAPGENRPVKLQGIARVDTRGKKSSIGGAGRVTGLGPNSNFSFSGRQTNVNRCVNLLADFEGDDETGAGGLGEADRVADAGTHSDTGVYGPQWVDHRQSVATDVTGNPRIQRPHRHK